jgi:hypothetical protein
MYNAGSVGVGATGGALAYTGFDGPGVLLTALAAALLGLVLLRFAMVDMASARGE